MAAGAPTDPVADLPRLHRSLLSWYDAHRRDLPWRGVQDPYAIWVSEIMLQQTRVETVVPYFLRWIAAFPDVHTLAAASEEEVLRLWSGLGYYTRARNLQAAARVVVGEHGGTFPTRRAALQRLPGIGPYTSGAIASIAFGERVPAVDGNVLRVLARLFADPRDIRDPMHRKAYEAMAARLVPAARPGDWNQALMELGATCCTPSRPACGRCPLVSHCAAQAEGLTADLPVRRPKKAPREERMCFAWIESDGAVLLVRNDDQRLLGGLWGLPGGPATEPLERLVADQTGLRVAEGPALGAATHRFTHRTWQMEVRAARPAGPAGVGAGDGRVRWVPLASLADEAVSTAHRKAMAAALAVTPAPS